MKSGWPRLSKFRAPNVIRFEQFPYLLGGVLLVGSVWVSYYALHEEPPSLSVLATLISANVAYFALSVSSVISRLNIRKQHTINFISQTRYNGKIYRENVDVILSFDRRGKNLPVAQEVLKSAGGDRDYIGSARWLLNYWDFVAVGCYQGDFDFDAVHSNLRAMFVTVVHEFAHLIGERRYQEPRSWQHLIWMYLYCASHEEMYRTLLLLGPFPAFLSPNEELMWEFNGGMPRKLAS